MLEGIKLQNYVPQKESKGLESSLPIWLPLSPKQSVLDKYNRSHTDWGMGMGQSQGVWVKEPLHWVSEFKPLDLRECPCRLSRENSLWTLRDGLQVLLYQEGSLALKRANRVFVCVDRKKNQRARKFKSAS